MAIYNAYTKALNILKNRTQYWDNQASYDDKTEDEKAVCLARSSAYNSAWWILYYAIHEDWECLDQFDYYERISDDDESEEN